MENRNLAVTNQRYCLICDWQVMTHDLKNIQLFRDTLNFVYSLKVLCVSLVPALALNCLVRNLLSDKLWYSMGIMLTNMAAFFSCYSS